MGLDKSVDICLDVRVGMCGVDICLEMCTRPIYRHVNGHVRRHEAWTCG